MAPEIPFPDYQNPPVAEVVFAVAMRPLPLSVVDLAQFGLERLSPDFTGQNEQPPMHMPTESFDGDVPALGPSIQMLSGPVPTRLLFQSNDDTRLVQIQRDWFACNWRGASPGVSYPRYDAIEDFFLTTWDSLGEFVLKRGVSDQVVVHQCELSYINHIDPGVIWERPGQIHKLIRLTGEAGSFLPEPEDGQFVFRYRMTREGKFVGRLIVNAIPGIRRTDQKSVIQLSLTARGIPIGNGREGVALFFRLAHEWIVKGFAAVTTEEAQDQLWRRIS